MLFSFVAKTTTALLLLSAVLIPATAAEYQEGQDYITVTGIPETTKPVVREFFSYNCPHCYHQDPVIEKTAQLLKGKVTLARTPVGAHRPAWVLSQEVYYLAQKFKIVNQVHSKIFARIHEQHQPFTTEADLETFFVSQGIDKTLLEKTIGSADAKLAMENYEAQTQLAQVRGVPSLLVNGKYLIKANVSDAEALSELILFLAKKPD